MKTASCSNVRFYVIALSIFCPMICFISRYNLSIAIVAMVNETKHLNNDRSSYSANVTQQLDNRGAETYQYCPIASAYKDSNNDPNNNATDTLIKQSYGPKYNWTNMETGRLTAAFFWPYVIFQLPLARVAEIVGAHWVLAAAGIGSALTSFAAPWAASRHLYVFGLTRAIMGTCQTALFPSCYILFTKWCPPTQRSLVLTLMGVGGSIGSILASSISGLLCEIPSLGWPSVFYLSGAACAVWSIAWLAIGSSEPRTQRCVSQAEIEHIESHMELRKSPSSSSRKVPDWGKILTSPAVWAYIMTVYAANWSSSVVHLLLPMYYNSVLNISVFHNGIFNSLMPATQCVASLIIGPLATVVIRTKPFGITHLCTRKLFEGTAMLGTCTCFALIQSLGCNQTLVVGLMLMQTVLYCGIYGGRIHLPSELTLDFVGSLYALGNTIGSTTGFVVPYINGIIVSDRTDRLQWNRFFYLSSFITGFGGLVFIVFGRNHLHDFAVPESNRIQLSRLDSAQTDNNCVKSISIDQSSEKKLKNSVSSL